MMYFKNYFENKIDPQKNKFNLTDYPFMAYVILDTNEKFSKKFYISKKIKITASLGSIQNEFEKIWKAKTFKGLELARFTKVISEVDKDYINKWIDFVDLPETLQRDLAESPLIYIEGFA